MKYSANELRRAVRMERYALQRELIDLSKRIRTVEERLRELDKADNLLEGE